MCAPLATANIHKLIDMGSEQLKALLDQPVSAKNVLDKLDCDSEELEEVDK